MTSPETAPEALPPGEMQRAKHIVRLLDRLETEHGIVFKKGRPTRAHSFSGGGERHTMLCVEPNWGRVKIDSHLEFIQDELKHGSRIVLDKPIAVLADAPELYTRWEGCETLIVDVAPATSARADRKHS